MKSKRLIKTGANGSNAPNGSSGQLISQENDKTDRKVFAFGSQVTTGNNTKPKN
jgi:hypothetical protein